MGDRCHAPKTKLVSGSVANFLSIARQADAYIGAPGCPEFDLKVASTWNAVGYQQLYLELKEIGSGSGERGVRGKISNRDGGVEMKENTVRRASINERPE